MCFFRVTHFITATKKKEFSWNTFSFFKTRPSEYFQCIFCNVLQFWNQLKTSLSQISFWKNYVLNIWMCFEFEKQLLDEECELVLKFKAPSGWNFSIADSIYVNFHIFKKILNIWLKIKQQWYFTRNQILVYAYWD